MIALCVLAAIGGLFGCGLGFMYLFLAASSNMPWSAAPAKFGAAIFAVGALLLALGVWGLRA